MPRLIRFSYNRKAAEDACRKGLPLASDGKICPHEEDEFRTIMKEMVELERWIGELKFFALRHGIDVGDIMPGREAA